MIEHDTYEYDPFDLFRLYLMGFISVDSSVASSPVCVLAFSDKIEGLYESYYQSAIQSDVQVPVTVFEC